MHGLNETVRAEVRSAVHGASGRGEVRAAVHALYQHLQDAIELRGPVCESSGRCCRFDEYGHRLFVSTMELATFIHDLGAGPGCDESHGHGCPFQSGKLCTVHAFRPFGCRVFYCDPTARTWQEEQYERFHTRLRRLHDELKVPYFYLEWREGLAALGLTFPAGNTPVGVPELL